MDISALSIISSSQSIMTDVNIAMLSKNLDSIDAMGDQFKKMLEQSVQPNLGQNIDITV